MDIWVGVAIVFGFSSLRVLLALERKGAQETDTTFRIKKDLVSFFDGLFLVSLVLGGLLFLSEKPNHGLSNAFPAVIMGIISISCSLVYSLYEVRLEESHLRYGLRGCKRIPYSTILEIKDVQDKNSSKMILSTSLGRIGLWRNLLEYEELLVALKSKRHCKYSRTWSLKGC
jgi:hypothetical protein